MTGPDLARSALVIPPRGRALLCLWGAVPGLAAAPFAFYQGAAAGAAFCLGWAALLGALWARAASWAAALGPASLTVYAGLFWPVVRRVRRDAVTAVTCFTTPLARRGRLAVLVVRTPGQRLVLPGLDAAQAQALADALLAGRAQP